MFSSFPIRITSWFSLTVTYIPERPTNTEKRKLQNYPAPSTDPIDLSRERERKRARRRDQGNTGNNKNTHRKHKHRTCTPNAQIIKKEKTKRSPGPKKGPGQQARVTVEKKIRKQKKTPRRPPEAEVEEPESLAYARVSPNSSRLRQKGP